MRFLLTKISENRKTGPIPVAISSPDTCPESCVLKGKGCYAENGHLALHWRRVAQVGMIFEDFLKAVRALPRRQLWRYGQAGDLPERREDVLALADANAQRPVLCYTHRRDFDTYREATERGFVVNLSADSLADADALAKTGLPVVAVLPSFFHRGINESLSEYRARLGGKLKTTTPGGIPVAICPATYLEVTCATCQACAKPRPRDTIVGFPAHGTRRKLIDVQLGVVGVENDRESRRVGPT